MSSSWNCEEELRSLAADLYRQAAELEAAAEVLRTLRETDGINDKIKKAKQWAKDWMKP